MFVTALTSPDQTIGSTAGQPSFEEFVQQASAGRIFAVGRPVVGAVSRVPMVPMRLAALGKDDQIAFILSASLPQDYLSSYWKDATQLSKSNIGIIRDDGYVLSLYPIPQQTSKRSTTNREPCRCLSRCGESGCRPGGTSRRAARRPTTRR